MAITAEEAAAEVEATRTDVEQLRAAGVKIRNRLGEINQVVGLTGFAYDNIKAGKSAKANKPPGWMKDKLKEIKRQQPGATMGLPF